MAVYKVIARCPKTGKQNIKKIYETEDKFLKYGTDTVKRYQEFHDVEVYKMGTDEKYYLSYVLKKPRTKEEARQMQTDRGWNDYWYKHYIMNYLNG